ncbi:MAG: hypothetical protein AAF437_14780 [Pseudomonadota bacterium]
MSQTPKPDSLARTPFTLLAVTALAISNLIVGILQGNTWLIFASAALSTGFAYVYARRSGMLSANAGTSKTAVTPDAGAPEQDSIAPVTTFPLWIFLAVIFVMMPAILLFLQSVES